MITAIDLFAGGGGASTGLEMVPGVRVAVAVDNWPVALDTHRLNHPRTRHDCADISQVDPARYPATDMLWASPSCTHHSKAQGKRRVRGAVASVPAGLAELAALEPDRSRATALDVVRFAEHHRYRWIIVENVPELLSWALYPHWLACLTDGLGYRHRVVRLDAADVGVPQHRRRAFIQLWREDREPDPMPSRTPHTPVAAVLEDDPGHPIDRSRMSPAAQARIDRTLDRFPDQKRLIVPEYSSVRVGHPVDLPVWSVTTTNHHRLVTRRADGLHARFLNVRELAAIQGFPADYRWAGGARDVKKQIGNAVVPACAAAVTGSLVPAGARQ